MSKNINKDTDKIIKIGIDFGASRIKYMYSDHKGNLRNGIFLNKYLIGNNNAGTGYKVVRDDRINKVGAFNGKPNIQKLKINYNYLDDIILAVCKDIKNNTGCGHEMNISINALLPPAQYLSIAQKFKKKLLDYGTIEGKVDGDNLKVNIKDVGICCEGVAQLTMSNVQGYSADAAFLLDAGSSTIDVVQIELQGGHWNIVDADTVDDVSGSLIVKDITSGLNAEFPQLSLTAPDLERNMYFYEGETKHQLVNYIDFASDRIANLAQVFIDYYNGGKILVSGGAGELLMASETFRNICPVEPTLLDEEIRTFGNAKGAYFS